MLNVTLRPLQLASLTKLLCMYQHGMRLISDMRSRCTCRCTKTAWHSTMTACTPCWTPLETPCVAAIGSTHQRSESDRRVSAASPTALPNSGGACLVWRRLVNAPVAAPMFETKRGITEIQMDTTTGHLGRTPMGDLVYTYRVT